MKLFRKKKSKLFPPRVTVHAIINGVHREVTVHTVDLRQLHLFDTPITCLDRIDDISLANNMVILQMSSPAYRKNAWTTDPDYVPNYAVYNYADAYDYKGNHLWNIAEILGDIGCGISGARICTKNLLPADARDAYIEGHELLVCWSWYDRRYIIDLDDRKVIHEMFAR